MDLFIYKYIFIYVKNVFDIKVAYLNEDSSYVDRKIGSCVCDPLFSFSESSELSIHAWGEAKAVKGKHLYNIDIHGRVRSNGPID